MKIYEVKSKYNADFVYQLLEGSTLMPFTFDKLVSAMSVASHGLSIAFAYKQESITTSVSKSVSIQLMEFNIILQKFRGQWNQF